MRKTLLAAFSLTVLSIAVINNTMAQGCIALRGSGPGYMAPHPDASRNDKWIFTTGYGFGFLRNKQTPTLWQ